MDRIEVLVNIVLVWFNWMVLICIVFLGVEVVGVDFDGIVESMEKMLKEGVVGEVGFLFKGNYESKWEFDIKEFVGGDFDFNDLNYWCSEYILFDVVEKLWGLVILF